MTKPRFSVIIPTLNEEKFLPHLLDSLAEQTQRDFEVIVVDGNSRDKTVTVAQAFEKKLPKLTILKSEKASLPLQRNLGAKEARGDWFIFVDADSVFLPYCLKRIGQFIDSEKPELFTTWFRPDSEVSGDVILTLLGNIFIESSILFHRPLAPGPLTIMAKHVFSRVGGYDESLTFGEDYDFTKRATEVGFQLHILRETLYIYSLRRVRREGKLKLVNMYLRASLLVLLTKRNIRNMPGYIMGGHLYGRTKKSTSRIAGYEKKLKKIMKELFE